MVFSYVGTGSADWDGLKIEVQMRTRLQHTWSTAVETVDMFTGQDLKGSQGDASWLRFFVLMSAEFAQEEGTPLPPGVPFDQGERLAELKVLDQQLQVGLKLSAYDVVMKESGASVNRYHVMTLLADDDVPTLEVSSYERLADASSEFAKREESTSGISGADVVLVRAESMAALRRAYPNYFADTEVFRQRLAGLSSETHFSPAPRERR